MTHLLRAAASSIAIALIHAPTAGSAPPPWTPALQDTTALQFHSFSAGARLAELEKVIRGMKGSLRCDRAKRDPRVSECRGTVKDSTLGGATTVWVSAIDSVAGIITLSSGVDQPRLDRWRRAIESRYGTVSTRVQGSQRMMQWVRQRRMLRLTWRTDRGQRTASVSLVDGRVLDAWKPRPAKSP